MLIETVAEKDDLFAQSKLLEGKYKFSRETVFADEWPEFSFWEGDQVKTKKHNRGGNGDLLLNTEKQRAEDVNKEVGGNEQVGKSPNNCWSKAVASGQSFTLLKNTFWHCWLNGGH